MQDYNEVMSSITELRKVIDSKLEGCINQEKAERIAEEAVKKMQPAERKVLIPQDGEEVLAKAETFKNSARNTAEKAWTSVYGRKFGSMRNFLKAVRQNHPILSEGKALLNEGTGSAGGYLVPSEFSAEVIRMMGESSKIMKISNILPMSTWKRFIPRQLTNVSVGWVNEGAAHTESNPTFGQIEQVAKVLGAVIKCSDELIRDSAINLTAFLSELVADAMAAEIERVALVGSTAAGDPFNGIMNTSGVGAPVMTGAKVSFDDIAELVFSLNDNYAEDAVMVMSRSALKELIKIKDNTGNYIWQPPVGEVPATIWNTPYIISSQIPHTLGTSLDKTALFYGKFSKHLLISPRQEFEVKISQDASDWGTELQSAFMQDQTWLRFTHALSVNVAQPGAFACMLIK